MECDCCMEAKNADGMLLRLRTSETCSHLLCPRCIEDAAGMCPVCKQEFKVDAQEICAKCDRMLEAGTEKRLALPVLFSCLHCVCAECKSDWCPRCGPEHQLAGHTDRIMHERGALQDREFALGFDLDRTRLLQSLDGAKAIIEERVQQVEVQATLTLEQLSTLARKFNERMTELRQQAANEAARKKWGLALQDIDNLKEEINVSYRRGVGKKRGQRLVARADKLTDEVLMSFDKAAFPAHIMPKFDKVCNDVLQPLRLHLVANRVKPGLLHNKGTEQPFSHIIMDANINFIGTTYRANELLVGTVDDNSSTYFWSVDTVTGTTTRLFDYFTGTTGVFGIDRINADCFIAWHKRSDPLVFNCTTGLSYPSKMKNYKPKVLAENLVAFIINCDLRAHEWNPNSSTFTKLYESEARIFMGGNFDIDHENNRALRVTQTGYEIRTFPNPRHEKEDVQVRFDDPVQVLRFCPVDLPLTLVYYVTAGKLYIHDHAKPKAPMRLIPIESDACVMRFEQEGEKPDLLVATYRNNTITLLQ